jgi:hypothetical protein
VFTPVTSPHKLTALCRMKTEIGVPRNVVGNSCGRFESAVVHLLESLRSVTGRTRPFNCNTTAANAYVQLLNSGNGSGISCVLGRSSVFSKFLLPLRINRIIIFHDHCISGL